MRNSLNPQYPFGEFRNTQGESFGRIARSSSTSRLTVGSPSSNCANDADAAARDEGEALALRALAANGFGEAALTRSGDRQQLAAAQPAGEARAHRSRGVAQVAASVARDILDRVRIALARMKRRAQARATVRALSALDSRTLHDLGFHRSEILSIAAEVRGDLVPTRLRAEQTLRGLS